MKIPAFIEYWIEKKIIRSPYYMKMVDKMVLFFIYKYPDASEHCYRLIVDKRNLDNDRPLCERLADDNIRRRFFKVLLERLDVIEQLNKEEREKRIFSELDLPTADEFIISKEIAKKVRWWCKTADRIPYLYLEDYFPQKYGVDDEQARQVRNDVWTFKNSSPSVHPVQHARVLVQVARRLEEKLKKELGDNLQHITWVCVPASTQYGYMVRFAEFSRFICRITSMTDGTPHVEINGFSTPKHLGGISESYPSFRKDWFKNRRVLLFDDVITTGKTVGEFARQLEAEGAKVFGAVFMARTAEYDSCWYRSQNGG